MIAKKNSFFSIPKNVPTPLHKNFITHYETITKKTGCLFLFAADQKIEHLHEDFYGHDLPKELNSPEYLFELADSHYIGAFATHLGLITQYAEKYPNINYIAKLNGKTLLVPTSLHEPYSKQLWTVDDVLDVKNSGVPIHGVGYTIYIGSEYESQMLYEAAQIIHQAHRVGLVTILWIYARGKAVKNELNGMLAAGAAGVAASLGSDFVKIKPPTSDATHNQAEWITIAQQAAGTTKVICSGQEHTDASSFLKQLYEQLHIGHAGGAAIGRNIFQRPKPEAQKFIQAVAALIYENVDLVTALGFIQKNN